ncbi:hypothetical protein BS78_05G271200 [Paspalum vaginatum]|nr:hypothetical protein BS78_05G271200 [Paspalum vaginatum]
MTLIVHVFDFIIVTLLRLLDKIDKSSERFVEDKTWLEDILIDEPKIEYDSANENLEPEDPHAKEVLAAKHTQELAKDPNYEPSVEEQQMDEEPTTPHQNQSEQECIEATRTSKRKRGTRAKNKLPETVYVVNEVGIAGQPLEPYSVQAKFRNTVGVVVRTYLNDKYVKNNLTPFDEFSRITQAQWDEFVRQKTTEEAIELSKANTMLAKRDTHKPHLGPSGYAAKVDKWNKEREDAIAKGLPDLYEGVNERMFHWCKAREVKVVRGEKDSPKPETKKVVSRIMSLAEEHKAGKFVPDREKDFLTVAIGTKEHGGRCRGISSKLNWKEGFAEDHYNQEMRETAEQVFKERFFTFVKNTPGLAIPGLASSLGLDSSPGLASSPGLGSTPCLVVPLPSGDQHAIDSITSPTPCEVARALVIPGSGLFHGTPIPPDYARVQVHSVEPKHEGERLDISTPEGIHFLGQSVDQFILWHKNYIMNLAPQEQLELEHGPIGDTREEEHVVPK